MELQPTEIRILCDRCWNCVVYTYAVGSRFTTGLRSQIFGC